MDKLCVAGGQVVVDHIAHVGQLPEADAVSLQPGFHRQLTQEYPGGCSCNIASAAAKLGLQVVYAGLIGCDAQELPCLAPLRNRFMGEPWLIGEEPTCHCYQIYDRENRKLSFMDGLLVPKAGCYDHLDGGGPLLCLAAPRDGGYAPSLIRLMRRTQARGHDTAVSLVSGDQPLSLELIMMAKYIFLNEYEAGRLLRQSGETELADLFHHGATAIFETVGSRGVRVYRSQAPEPVLIPSVPVARVEDTTGAGDAFAGGAMAALRFGYDPLTAAKVGCVTASFAVQVRGAQTGQPDWRQMKTRYETCYGRLEERN